MNDRDELYRRLAAAHTRAQTSAAASRRDSTDRGALVEALVLDGASLAEIGRRMESEEAPGGISKQSVQKMLDRYRSAAGRPRPVVPKPRGQCPGCRQSVIVTDAGMIRPHDGCQIVGQKAMKVVGVSDR